MSRAVPHTRLPALLAVILGSVFLVAPHLQTAATAASFPYETKSSPSRYHSLQPAKSETYLPDADAADAHLLINEIDSETPGIDDAEFVELYDGGRGNTPLDGLTIVLYNGHEDSAYASFDLNGFSTDEQGYFVLGSRNVTGVDLVMADSLLQNGADAVALYRTSAAEMPVGAPVSTESLLDAIVYGTDEAADEGLLVLLHPGETQVNENGRELEDFHSLQRCPNGSGEQRRTNTYQPFDPTPKGANGCDLNGAPTILGTVPASDASDVPLDSSIAITFSEEVEVIGTWFDLSCTQSGSHEATVSGGGVQYSLQPLEPFVFGEQCQVTLAADQVNDLDANDPPDHLNNDHSWSFTVMPAGHMLINEVDADTAGTDTVEFIELYDGGSGNTALNGLVLVLFSGADDLSYRAVDLDDRQTDEQGRYVIGDAAVPGVDQILPDGFLQNGADAVALYRGDAIDFPNGSAITPIDLLDAVVYGSSDEADSGLLVLLLDDEAQIDEDGRSNAAGDSNQRCPDGAGDQRRTNTFRANLATPGETNKCVYDAAPFVTNTIPANGASNVAVDSQVKINFSEAVDLGEAWFTFRCQKMGDFEVEASYSENQAILKPLIELAQGDTCTVTIYGAMVRDSDLDDPPDPMAANYVLDFQTITPIPEAGIVINEVDADTGGLDSAEFIELYDGGAGNTPLDGLVVVFYSGRGAFSYAAIDLDGYVTDGQGYFLLGNAAVSGVDHTIPDGALQNGPDAVALYAGDAAGFANGTAVTTQNLLEAFVYSTGDEGATGLVPLLLEGEEIVDEDGRAAKDLHSSQRCPNGSGGQRQTGAFLQNRPTPKAVNFCVIDEAPRVSAHKPEQGASGVARDARVVLTFSEDVALANNSVSLTCSDSNAHVLALSGGPAQYTLELAEPMSEEESCEVTIAADKVTDLDNNDPPDWMEEDYRWSFETESIAAARHVLINEVDADTEGIDTAEFIELYDGGAGSTALDGLTLVFYNGADNQSYRSIDLDGHVTDGKGYFLLGNSAVAGVDHILADGVLQNGPDAIALYDGDAIAYPNGTPVTADNLLDALIYGSGEKSAPQLGSLLYRGEQAVDEDGRDAKDAHSNQRCPNGAGGQRRTGTFLQNRPTPKAANFCVVDEPPDIREVFPAEGSRGVARNATLSATFSEAVTLEEGAISLNCTKSGPHQVTISGGPSHFQIQPTAPFDWGEICTTEVLGSQVADADVNDPPDEMDGDYSWSFETETIPVARHMLINEVDADTEGVDTAEFIELFDGGAGGTALEGLVVVLVNGNKDQAYRRIDLAGYKTDADGYFVVGGPTVPGVDLAIAAGVIQNGPDAVALYAADEYEENDRGKPLVGGLLDALVYHTNDEADPGLSYLVLKEEPQVNEGRWRDAAVDSSQRCPNGAGGQRKTAGIVQNQPTPGSVNNCTLDTPPQVETVFPADGSQDVAVDSKLAVHFDEPVEVEADWISVTCEQQGSLDLTVAVGPQDFEIEALQMAPFDSCIASIKRDKVRDLDGFPDALIADFSWQFVTGIPVLGTCGDEATPIHIIQGSGATSPISGKVGVIVEGVVVGDFQGAKGLEGFFVQEETADADGDPLTSEGIFASGGPGSGEINAGETVRLQGDVVELAGTTSLINVTEWQICGIDSDVQAPIISLPAPENHSWEAFEGMVVTFSQTLTVVGSERWGSEGIVDLASDRLYCPTQIAQPGAAALIVADQNRRKRIALDDGSGVNTPLPYPAHLGPGNRLRLGDAAGSVTGIVAEYGGEYRIQPTQAVQFSRENLRPDLAQPLPGSTRVAHISSGGFYNGNGKGRRFIPGHGAQSKTEYERQRAKLVNAVLATEAGIIGLTEIENDGLGETSALRDLTDALNASAGAGQTYEAVTIPGDVQSPFVDRVVLLYRADVVTAEGAPISLNSYPFEGHVRPPVGQTFVVKTSGERFMIIVAQFPERGDCPAAGDPNADQGDGQACWNQLRRDTASALANWINELHDVDGNEVVILGDLNSFYLEDPPRILKEAGLVHVMAQGQEMGYSAVIDGELGALNDGFFTAGLQAIQVQRWHINADEPAALDYRTTNQPALYMPNVYRSAAGDPLVIDLAPVEPDEDLPLLVYLPVFFQLEIQRDYPQTPTRR